MDCTVMPLLQEKDPEFWLLLQEIYEQLAAEIDAQPVSDTKADAATAAK